LSKPLRAVAAIACALLALEAAAQLLARGVLRDGRLFQPDAVLGWKPIPNLVRTRGNPAGGTWTARINERGFRGNSRWDPDAPRRVLILGDSFAFGQGVDIEDRFDTLLAAHRPSWSFVNLGVPGYGTDQELIAGRSYFGSLRPGDVILLFTSSADFLRIVQKHHSGRSKPWFSYERGRLREHPPEGGLLQALRDRSYLAGRLMWLLQIRQSSRIAPRRYRQGIDLYRVLVRRELGPLSRRGVRVLIPHHDLTAQGQMDRVRALFRGLGLEEGFEGLSLEERRVRPACCFRDGHWTPAGHRAVAEALRGFLAGAP